MQNKITTKKIINFKKSKLKFPIIKELEERFSPRLFSEETINKNILNSMFEAARWAPSAYNFQPWYFYFTQKDSVIYKHILSCLPERNQWANTAQVLVVACYLKKRENKTNKYAKYDLGSAVMSMIIEAKSLGIYCRQIGIFSHKRMIKLLNINNEQEPFVVLAVGKIGDYTKIDQELLKKEFQKRERKINIVSKK